MNQILKPEIVDPDLILDQLVDAGARLMAVISKLAPAEQFRGSIAQPGMSAPPRPLEAEDLKRLLKLRSRRRSKPVGQFLDWPAWDMLLDLAAVRAENGHVSVSAVCISSGAPQSTALRKLAALENAGLVRRYLHGTDRRRVCLALTDEGSEFVTGVLAEEVAFYQDIAQGK